jgi:hypothetical protein
VGAGNHHFTPDRISKNGISSPPLPSGAPTTMPSVIGSPAHRYTPPSSNDESGALGHFNHTITSTSHTKQHLQVPSSTLNIGTRQLHPEHQSVSTTPPSSSEDSPTTSGGDNTFPHDDTDMLDYDEYSHSLGDDSLPPPLFFGDRQGVPQSTSRFTSLQVSHEGFSPFSAELAGLNPTRSSPEFKREGDSPGLGSDMRGLRLNSGITAPMQGTVRMEDVMLPTDNAMGNDLPQSGTLFENKVEIQRVETGLIKPYYYLGKSCFLLNLVTFHILWR